VAIVAPVVDMVMMSHSARFFGCHVATATNDQAAEWSKIIPEV
jgi:hypothetical protein